jgi:hypothetical protein
MWNRTREGLQVLRGKGQLGAWHEAIDRYHLMERLAVALKLVEPDMTAAASSGRRRGDNPSGDRSADARARHGGRRRDPRARRRAARAT